MKRATPRPLRACAWLGVALLSAGCTGKLGDAPEGPPGSPSRPVAGVPACDGRAPGDSPVRRMTRAEYDNTVRDLLGDTTSPAEAFVPEEKALGFDNQATALGVTAILAEQYQTAAEQIAERATTSLPTLLRCDPMHFGDEACAARFIVAFGKRAFRRPVAPDEAARLLALYTAGKAKYDTRAAVELVLSAMLQSPRFLYRIELGMPDAEGSGVVPLDAYELASRLSYLLWASMPDGELFQAADEGRLGTREELAAQARRMLADPRARKAVASFHVQWLGLDGLDTLTKDAKTYPAYTPALRALFREETEAFLDHVIFEGEGDLGTLLTAPYSMLDAELSAFYGVKGPRRGAAFEKVALRPDQRAGLLTQGSVLAVHAHPDQSSPVRRGKLVRERLLCQVLPPPPANVPPLPKVDPHASTRQRLDQHASLPECAGCHRLMDPIGFGFEHYDGTGAWRADDAGSPVDATGAIVATAATDGPFDGAVELARRLAGSDEVRRCVVTQWFRYGYGRVEGAEDACTLKGLDDAFAASRYDIKELLVALTQTDAFRYRKKVVPGG